MSHERSDCSGGGVKYRSVGLPDAVTSAITQLSFQAEPDCAQDPPAYLEGWDVSSIRVTKSACSTLLLVNQTPRLLRNPAFVDKKDGGAYALQGVDLPPFSSCSVHIEPPWACEEDSSSEESLDLLDPNPGFTPVIARFEPGHQVNKSDSVWAELFDAYSFIVPNTKILLNQASAWESFRNYFTSKGLGDVMLEQWYRLLTSRSPVKYIAYSGGTSGEAYLGGHPDALSINWPLGLYIQDPAYALNGYVIQTYLTVYAYTLGYYGVDGAGIPGGWDKMAGGLGRSLIAAGKARPHEPSPESASLYLYHDQDSLRAFTTAPGVTRVTNVTLIYPQEPGSASLCFPSSADVLVQASSGQDVAYYVIRKTG